jgi:hypothetical protein
MHSILAHFHKKISFFIGYNFAFPPYIPNTYTPSSFGYKLNVPACPFSGLNSFTAFFLKCLNALVSPLCTRPGSEVLYIISTGHYSICQFSTLKFFYNCPFKGPQIVLLCSLNILTFGVIFQRDNVCVSLFQDGTVYKQEKDP